ncbi:MAG: hypothetical protein ACQES5_01200 [Thermodesulfobacteriota bacterium]
MNTFQQLPILISQTPNLQRFQVAIQDAPGTQQHLMGALAVERHKRAKQQIPKTDKTETNLSVREEDHEQRKHKNMTRQSQQKKNSGDQDDIEKNIDPNVGNILNLEI